MVVKLSVIAAPVREVTLATSCGFPLATCRHPPRSKFSAFCAKTCALAAVWRTRALQTTCLLEWIGPPPPSTPKVCTFTALLTYTIRKPLSNPSRYQICALRKVILSFSLRFCSAFKNRCKTPAKIKSVLPKRYTLHTVSTHTRIFERWF